MKDSLVKRFVIGTFVSLYALVSVISTIHVIDFFELSNPYWLAVTLAIGFEIGAAASLASLVILKKMNKTIVWSLFIAITLMQMQGNMYYAFINLEGFSGWSELFDLIEEDLIDQKRILAFVSGAILPLIALGFIKSLVDYIKPEEDEEPEEIISSGTLDDFESQPSKEFFEDIVDKPTTTRNIQELDDEDLAAWREISDDIERQLDEEITDFSPDEEYDAYVDRHEPGSWLKKELEDSEELDDEVEDKRDELDRIHALDTALNDMVKDMDVKDLEEINDVQEPNPTSVGSIVQKLATPHLPKEEPLAKTQDQLWDEAMAKKAKSDMEAFIKNKNANK